MDASPSSFGPSKAQRHRWRRAVLAALVFGVMLPATALAFHLRSDVPTAHQFHDDIGAIILAGIGTEDVSADPGLQFGPGLFTNRGRQAQWLHLSLSRAAVSGAVLASSIDFSPTPFTNDDLVAQVSLTVGGAAAPGANQFVKVEGILNLRFTGGGSVDVCYYLVADINSPANRSDLLCGSVIVANMYFVFPVNWVFPAAPGEHTFKLYARTLSEGAIANVVEASVVATTHAFGSSGTNVLSAP
jgi:hypothetical protein